VLGANPEYAVLRWRDSQPVTFDPALLYDVALSQFTDGLEFDPRAGSHTHGAGRNDIVSEKLGVYPQIDVLRGNDLDPAVFHRETCENIASCHCGDNIRLPGGGGSQVGLLTENAGPGGCGEGVDDEDRPQGKYVD